jgi:hypothetical protein
MPVSGVLRGGQPCRRRVDRPAHLVCSLALIGVLVLALVLARRTRRLRAAEDAVVLLARSWSEDGSSRGRLCAAAQQVADAKLAFLAEPTRRNDGLVVTATAEASDMAGASFPLDPSARCWPAAA